MLTEISQERSKLEDIVNEFNDWEARQKSIVEAKELFEASDDPEMREMSREEMKVNEEACVELEVNLFELAPLLAWALTLCSRRL